MHGRRVLNPGSVGLPRRPGVASWLFIDATATATTAEHRGVAFSVQDVIDDLVRRRHPNREFISGVLQRGTFAPSPR